MIEAIATAAQVDPIDLPPLNESIDPDALDALFSSTDDPASTEMVIGFVVDDWQVFLRGDGSISVCDPSQRAESTPLFETTDAAHTD